MENDWRSWSRLPAAAPVTWMNVGKVRKEIRALITMHQVSKPNTTMEDSFDLMIDSLVLRGHGTRMSWKVNNKIPVDVYFTSYIIRCLISANNVISSSSHPRGRLAVAVAAEVVKSCFIRCRLLPTTYWLPQSRSFQSKLFCQFSICSCLNLIQYTQV